MTTTNGVSQSRIAEHVEGVVQGANERGIHLQDEQDWRNWSKWADKPAEPPRRGTHVALALDGSGFIRELQVLASGASASESPGRAREIRRMAAMKTAAQLVGAFAQTHEEVRTEHVFPLADRILAWLERDEEST